MRLVRMPFTVAAVMLLLGATLHAARAAAATPVVPASPSSADAVPSAATDARPSVAAAAPDGSPLAAVLQSLQEAINATPDSILAQRARLLALLAADPKSPVLHYWIGYADYRVVPRLMKDKSVGERYCKDGLEHLERAIALDPKFADAIALKGGTQGLSIMLDPSRGMTVGAMSEETIGRAKGLAPENPRVVLIDGINTFNKPKFVGGGADKALVKFKKAQQLFAAEAAGSPGAIRWGRVDAYAWAGRAAVRLKQYDAARAFYRQALSFDPNNAWVQAVLLPEVERAAKEKP